MKAMLLAFLAIVIIAFGANFYLINQEFSASEQATGNSVRLD